MRKTRKDSRLEVWTGTDLIRTRDAVTNSEPDAPDVIQMEPIPGSKYMVEVVPGKAQEALTADEKMSRRGYERLQDTGPNRRVYRGLDLTTIANMDKDGSVVIVIKSPHDQTVYATGDDIDALAQVVAEMRQEREAAADA